jgi:hypothetical protein
MATDDHGMRAPTEAQPGELEREQRCAADRHDGLRHLRKERGHPVAPPTCQEHGSETDAQPGFLKARFRRSANRRWDSSSP